MSGRFAPLHHPLTPACRLVGVLGSVVEIAALAMFHTWWTLAPGSAQHNKLSARPGRRALVRRKGLQDVEGNIAAQANERVGSCHRRDACCCNIEVTGIAPV